MNKANDALVILTLTFAGVLSITPFAVMRFVQGDWLVCLVDAIMVLSMFSLWLYVKLTRKVDFASKALVFIALSGLVIVIYLKGPSLLFWAYPTLIGTFFLLAPNLAMLLTLITISAIIPSLTNQMTMTDITLTVITLVINNIFAYVFARQKNKQRDLLSQLVILDPLTGAKNRRALDEKLIELIDAHKRSNQIAILIFLDIDHFKSINDIYGHSMGDQVLIKLTKLIEERIRITDYLYRFGGEEFVILLNNTDLNTSRVIAEELRHIIESTEFIKERTITASLGIAAYTAPETANSWLDRGDKALYEAKESGRNRTCTAK